MCGTLRNAEFSLVYVLSLVLAKMIMINVFRRCDRHFVAPRRNKCYRFLPGFAFTTRAMGSKQFGGLRLSVNASHYTCGFTLAGMSSTRRQSGVLEKCSPVCAMASSDFLLDLY